MDNENLAVLGSTGSIGRQTLEVVRALGDRFRIIALSAGENTGLLAEQIEEFHPRLVHCQGPAARLTDGAYRFLPMEDIARHHEVDAHTPARDVRGR